MVLSVPTVVVSCVLSVSSMSMDASHLLSPVRPPTELAEERSAISTDLSDAISSVPKQDHPAELNWKFFPTAA